MWHAAGSSKAVPSGCDLHIFVTWFLLSQSQGTTIERREDNPIPALRQYVEALGGELELVAILGHKRIKLVGV